MVLNWDPRQCNATLKQAHKVLVHILGLGARVAPPHYIASLTAVPEVYFLSLYARSYTGVRLLCRQLNYM